MIAPGRERCAVASCCSASSSCVGFRIHGEHGRPRPQHLPAHQPSNVRAWRYHEFSRERGSGRKVTAAKRKPTAHEVGVLRDMLGASAQAE